MANVPNQSRPPMVFVDCPPPPSLCSDIYGDSDGQINLARQWILRGFDPGQSPPPQTSSAPKAPPQEASAPNPRVNVSVNVSGPWNDAPKEADKYKYDKDKDKDKYKYDKDAKDKDKDKYDKDVSKSMDTVEGDKAAGSSKGGAARTRSRSPMAP